MIAVGPLTCRMSLLLLIVAATFVICTLIVPLTGAGTARWSSLKGRRFRSLFPAEETSPGCQERACHTQFGVGVMPSTVKVNVAVEVAVMF